MKHKIIQVVPLTNVASGTGVFSYSTEQKVSLGALVQVSFGNKNIEGVVWNVSGTGCRVSKTTNYKLKAISSIVDPVPVLNNAQRKLAKWISEYYICSLGLVVKTILPKRLKREPKTLSYKLEAVREKPFKLNSAQENALEAMSSAPDKGVGVVLHGITGSGKTEVYMQAIAKELGRGKQALVLVPEISLTPQATERFERRFGADKIAITHSGQSVGERYREWLRIRKGAVQIVVGPRSALFAPFKKLGIIVIDEEHERSYKQWDTQPMYHARAVAGKYAELTGAKLILGSATPSIETYAKSIGCRVSGIDKKYALAQLPKRINNIPLPKIDVVDMREELKSGNKSIISTELESELKKVLRRKKQAILFLNRRGAATSVLCRDCGYTMECPDCQIPLTYHRNNNSLQCHYCGYSHGVPTVCPECGSRYIKFFGAGTERLESEVTRLFPKTKITRLDKDSTTRKEAHLNKWTEFSSGKSDILIGTQMVAKGLDLPNIKLIGIIAADSALKFPDFRSEEIAFTSIVQVAGRTNRKKADGRVILQTYNPDNDTIKFAIKHDYAGFYKYTVKQRKEAGYPPFTRLIKISTAHRNSENAMQILIELKKKISMEEILGPFSPRIAYKRGLAQAQLLIKLKPGPMGKDLLHLLSAEKNIKIDVDPIETI